MDSQWHDSHTRLEYWKEVQRAILRTGWSHDDSYTVGTHGDKAWAAWIMKNVGPGIDMGSCMAGHSERAMRLLTNQDVGDKSDDWLKWWQANKDKSQEQWIVDGFRENGFVLTTSPTKANIDRLLELIGESRDQERQDHLAYNSYRWLRDSGFDAVKFAIDNKDLAAKQKTGLIEYERFQQHYPTACKVGILPFGEDKSWFGMPIVSTPTYKLKVHASIWMKLVVGMGFVALSFRKHVMPSNVARRCFQFSIGKLLIVTLTLAAFFAGWIASEVRHVATALYGGN